MNYINTDSGLRIKLTQLDEYMIKNMISVLNSPNILQTFSAEEQTQMYEAVRNHMVIRSSIMLENQNEYFESIEKRHKR